MGCGVVRVLCEHFKAADCGIWVDGVGPCQSEWIKIVRGGCSRFLKSVLGFDNHVINGALTSVTVIWIWWWIGRLGLDEGGVRGGVHFSVFQCRDSSLGGNSVVSLSLGLGTIFLGLVWVCGACLEYPQNWF